MTGQSQPLLPYKPSFLHRFYIWLDRASRPALWLFYFLLIILPGIIQHMMAWERGLLPAGAFHPTLGFSTIWLVEILLVGHWMHRSGGKYFNEYRPLLPVDDAEFERLKLKYSHVPNPGAILVFLPGLAIGAATGYIQWQSSSDHVSFLLPGLRISEWALSNGLTLILAYQFIRQLRIMNELFRKRLAIDLFDLTPVYAFSKYTAFLALATFVIAYLTSLIFDPHTFSRSIVRAQNYIWVIAVLALFYFSLRGLNKRLEDEKDAMLKDVNLRIKEMFTRIHANFEQEDYQEAINMENMLSSLKTEKEIIQAIPTWPWQPGLFSALASALFLPLILTIIQLIITRLLNL